jgi:LytS/YehU family sensor histidine kinase
MILPFFTGQIPAIGSRVSPMHIPVLLCGFLSGPYYALIVGLIAPALRSLMFGMPPMYPTAIAMCFELAAYGAVTGFLYRALPKKPVFVYVSLVSAMIAGRVVWGLAMALSLGFTDQPFTWAAFVSGAAVNAVPGIIIHIALIPAIVLALRKSKILDVAEPLPSSSR